jgi:hypothetical protein
MNTLQKLQQLPSTKAEQKAFAESAVNEILAGDYGIIEAVALINAIKGTFDQILKDPKITYSIQSELDKYKEKTIDFNSFTITKAQRTTWAFDSDPVWQELKQRLTNREEAMKLAAKSIDKMFDSEGSEIPPATSKTAEYFTIKLK